MAKSLKTLSATALTLLILSFSPVTLATGGDLYLSDEDVYFSTDSLVENVPVMIYASAGNNSSEDLLGTIKFWNTTEDIQISSDQPISALANSTDTVFVTWTPPAGTHQISITVYPWESEGDDTSNNTVWETVTVDYDTDNDGVGNTDDSDDDNDGYPDYEDDFSLDPSEWTDTDGDGTGNNADEDDDNDGTPDTEDEMPLDYEETLDTDGDGIGNNKDSDDDGDGILDSEESSTDPLEEDSDQDGHSDSEDMFPMDSEEWDDYDNDGIGDNADMDDDNDGLSDDDDEYDQNAGPVIQVYTGIPFHFTGDDVLLDASNSYDKDGSVELFEWTKDGTVLGSEAIYTATYLESGKQTLQLTVTDDTGESRTETIKFRVYSKGFLIFLGLLIIILLCLAFHVIYRYSPRAKKVKPVKKVTKRKRKRKK